MLHTNNMAVGPHNAHPVESFYPKKHLGAWSPPVWGNRHGKGVMTKSPSVGRNTIAKLDKA